jgi:hypothetical protein
MPRADLKTKRKNTRKQNREILLSISLFLLRQEALRKQFWTVKTVTYDRINQQLNIGINTTNGKLGTTLAKLRKTSKDLSKYLYDEGLTFRKAKINFYVDKEDIEIERIYNLLNRVQN